MSDNESEVLRCESCNHIIDDDEQGTCSSCERAICDYCEQYCEGCERRICNNCNDSGLCPDCISHDDDSDSDYVDITDYDGQTLNHDVKDVNWSLHKMPWENTTYLGVELEMTYRESRESDVKRAAQKYLPNKHIWKEDGSLVGHGAELVITPMTLKYYRTLKMREMLSEIAKAGAISHDNPSCGLHVHVNKDALDKVQAQRVRAFFVANKSKIIKFTRRDPERLNQWANIPSKDTGDYAWKKAWTSGRYFGLNHTLSNTWEFWIFRGTLNYDTFRACLQFVDCLVSFVKNTSVATCCNGHGWSAFVSYAKKQGYNGLISYLLEHSLCA